MSDNNNLKDVYDWLTLSVTTLWLPVKAQAFTEDSSDKSEVLENCLPWKDRGSSWSITAHTGKNAMLSPKAIQRGNRIAIRAAS